MSQWSDLTVAIAFDKTYAGVELTVEEKLSLADTHMICGYHDDYRIPSIEECFASFERRPLRHSRALCPLALIDRELGWHYALEQHDEMMQEYYRDAPECDHYSPEELLVMLQQSTDTDWTPVNELSEPVPTWKLLTDRITHLLAA